MLTMREPLMIIAMSLLVLSFYFNGYSYSYSQIQVQPLTSDMITYSKQSSFIKEFNKIRTVKNYMPLCSRTQRL
jgi:hypothetical protein